MNIWILTLFPEMFKGVLSRSIIGRAQKEKKVKINLLDLRHFGLGRHKTVDDKPYGGGSGMIMRSDVIVNALETVKPKPYSILLAAAGKKYSQKEAHFFSKKKDLAIMCGHYEGVDARVEKFVAEVISLGDFVLTGGEIAAMAVVDSTVRLLPGVIKSESLLEESFSKLSTFNSQLSTFVEYPHYTRPREFRSLKVPKVLLSGNHRKITAWRKQETEKRTRRWRPDLAKSQKGANRSVRPKGT